MQETPGGSLTWKFPHPREQLSPRAITIEPVLQSLGAATTESTRFNYRSPRTLEPMLGDTGSHRNKKPLPLS